MKTLVVFCIILMSVAVSLAQPTFEEHESYSIGDSPYSLVAGDFNNDGSMDMISGNLSDPVDVLLAHSFFGFQVSEITTSTNNLDLDTADFNLDGNLDFAGVSTNDQMTIFIGNGDGTFGVTTYVAGDTPNDIAIGDFNEDTYPDVVVLNRQSDDMYVYYGDGTGSMGMPQIISVESTASKVTVADFNEDGDLDLLTGGNTSVEFYAGDGIGNFSAPIESTGFSGFDFLTSVDLDKDGDLDLLCAGSSFLYRAYGSGDGTFSDVRFFPEGANIAVTGDFNKDGNLDVVSNRYWVNYYEGDGTRDYSLWRRNKNGTAGRGMVVADWDKDGNLDIAINTGGGSGPEEVEVIYGKGDGYFNIPYHYSSPYLTRELSMGDLDEDGYEDLVVCSTTSIATLTDNVFVYKGSPDGTMTPVDTLDGGLAYDVEVLDINDDDNLDIAVLDIRLDQIILYTGDGTGALSSAGSFPVGSQLSMIAADVNKDDIDDLIFSGNTENVQIFEGNGDGTFSELANLDLMETIEHAIVADVNGDTNPDLAMIVDPSSGSDFARFYQGDGNGGFIQGGSDIPLTAGGEKINSDHFNTDGHTDFAITTGSTVVILLGDGAFAFSESSVNTNINEITAIGDFDGDGVKDLLASTDGVLWIYDGDGNGNFRTEWLFGLNGVGGHRVVVSDFNEDGFNDIAALASGNPISGLTILLNTSAPPPCEPASITGNPASTITRCEGESVFYSVNASGDSPLSYKWKKEGIDIPGATSSSLTLSDLTGDDAGVYTCEVSNACGTDTTPASTLTINSTPTSPTVAGAQACSSATVTLTASGSSDGNYRWYDVETGGVAISGEVNSSFITPALTATTTYYVSILENSCETDRMPVVATLQEGAAITEHPTSQSIKLGDPVTFTVTAAGEDLYYQWQKDGANITDETSSSLTLTSVTLEDAGDYSCEVSNPCSSIETNIATLTVTTATISLTSQPESAEVCETTDVIFTASATGTTNIAYQWQEDSGSGFVDLSDSDDVSGAKSASLSLPGISEALSGNNYRCIVSGDDAADVISTVAELLVIKPATILTQPSSVDAQEGNSVNLSMDVSGDDLQYQWQKDDNAIDGATTSQLSFNSVQLSDAGTYECIISNSCGAVTSDPAILTVGNVLGLPATFSHSIYPNPTAGILNISTSSMIGKMDVIIHDHTGRLVSKKIVQLDGADSHVRINENGSLESGIYLLLLQHQKYSTTYRFIIK